jgi:hypothetical protein
MDDIVERLVEHADQAHESGSLGWRDTMNEAADTITALRSENERLTMVLWDAHALCNNYPHFIWWPVHRIRRFIRAALTQEAQTDG